jgi:hypothetical protein
VNRALHLAKANQVPLQVKVNREHRLLLEENLVLNLLRVKNPVLHLRAKEAEMRKRKTAEACSSLHLTSNKH